MMLIWYNHQQDRMLRSCWLKCCKTQDIYAVQTDNVELLENMYRGEAIIKSDRLKVLQTWRQKCIKNFFQWICLHKPLPTELALSVEKHNTCCWVVKDSCNFRWPYLSLLISTHPKANCGGIRLIIIGVKMSWCKWYRLLTWTCCTWNPTAFQCPRTQHLGMGGQF